MRGMGPAQVNLGLQSGDSEPGVLTQPPEGHARPAWPPALGLAGEMELEGGSSQEGWPLKSPRKSPPTPGHGSASVSPACR